jgi:diguanylate cyclase (GGDEF)-like protein/PAS domain S-box-containing protein
MKLPFGKANAPTGAVAAAKSLFFGAAPLARSSGPVAIAREDGRVVAANGAAWKRLTLLGLAEAAPLRPEILTAIRKQRPEAFSIAADGVILAIEVLPLEPGAALLLGHETVATDALNEALADSRARYKALVELSSEFAWEADADGRFTFVSPKGALGYAAAELVGRAAASFCLVSSEASPFATRSRVDAVTVWWRKRDGGEACLSVSAAPVELDGRWIGARGVCRDATAERGQEDALARARRREDLIAYLVRLMRDAKEPGAMLASACEAASRALAARSGRIYTVAPNGDVEEAAKFGDGQNDGALTLLVMRAARSIGGFAAMETATGRRIGRPTLHRSAVNGVLVLERAPGAPAWSSDDRSLIAGIADQLGIALAQVATQAALERASRTDPLTGLLNRRAFESEMEARLKREANRAAPGALLLIDLDNFKQVNDMLGHERGDAALKAVAALLVARTRPGDLVARIGGDEFALWLERMDAEVAALRASQLVAAATAELAAFSAAPTAPLGFSIGVALRDVASDLTQLLSRADTAMYQAKRSGKSGFAFEKKRRAANA